MFDNQHLMHYLLVSLPLFGAMAAFFVVVASERLSWFPQFVKYGAVGVVSTYVQAVVFYLLGATCLMCLGQGDWAVEHLSLPCADISDSVRAYRFALATAVGFVVANLVCWVLNRMFVFKPGKFRWYIELALFFGVSLSATLIALAISSVMIHMLGLMTTIALVVEIVVSFMMNYFIRKFFIFKG